MFAVGEFTTILSRCYRIELSRLGSITGRGIFVTMVIVGVQGISACTAAGLETPVPAATESGHNAPDKPELGAAQDCLGHENGPCALAALAGLRNTPVAKTAAYLELKAEALALEHRQAEALTTIQSAIQADPSHPHSLITQGRIYLRFGNATDAIESFLKAAKLEPQSPTRSISWGRLFSFLPNTPNHPTTTDALNDTSSWRSRSRLITIEPSSCSVSLTRCNPDSTRHERTCNKRYDWTLEIRTIIFTTAFC